MNRDLLNEDQLQKPRTLVELCSFIAEVRNVSALSVDGWHHGMLRKGLFKQLVGEIIPVKDYAQSQYAGRDVLIKPVIGNQGYDAEILDSSSQLIERIEVTSPHDGDFESNDTKLAIERGFGKVRVYRPGEDVTNIARLILDAVKKKSKKDYSDSTLLIVVELTPLPSSALPDRSSSYRTAIESLVRELKCITYRAKKVAMLCPEKTVVEIHGYQVSQPDAQQRAGFGLVRRLCAGHLQR